MFSVLDQEFRGLPSDLEVALGSSVVLPCQVTRLRLKSQSLGYNINFNRPLVVPLLLQSAGFKGESWWQRALTKRYRW